MTTTSTTLTCDGCNAVMMNEMDARSCRSVAVNELGAVCDDTGDWCRRCVEDRAFRAPRGAGRGEK